MTRNWLITGVSSSFGRELTVQLLAAGEHVIGTVRNTTAVKDLVDQYPTAFMRMLDPANGLAPGDPARMATRIIESVDVEPAPLRIVLGSQALQSTLDTLPRRLADFETQTQLAASTDFPPGE